MAASNELSENNELEANCIELALEGQRLCRANEIKLGIKFFETALTLGTDDLNILMVVYSQLGNAYFSLRDYGKSLHYHRLDLDLSRRLGDLSGEGKASGNLGNTLKMLGKFDESITCCEHHLKICRELDDKPGIARALYNLANVFHNKAKASGAIGRQDLGQFPSHIQEALGKAAMYYRENLDLCKEIGDRATQGLTCGNLANTHYLLGNFQKAVELHTERLTIAKEFGHRAAERRAYSNRGNAYIFLANFESAIEDYRCALQLAKELNDETLEAQVCYSLGNTYYILRQYTDAAACLDHHLSIAKKLNDKMGEARACWSLTNIYSDNGDYLKAKLFASMHLEIATKLGDDLECNTARENITKLDVMIKHHNAKLNDLVSPNEIIDRQSVSDTSLPSSNGLNRNVGSSLKIPNAPKNTENLHIPKSVSQGALNKNQKILESGSGDRDSSSKKEMNNDDENDEDDFFSLLSKYQSRRMDEQRCSFHLEDGDDELMIGGRRVVLSPAQHEFLDLLAGVQGSRMNDQRASMPDFPGLRASPRVLSRLMANSNEGDCDSPSDAFIEMVMRCQATRIEDQRSNFPNSSVSSGNISSANQHSCPTVPDEDLFARILRLQSSRLDEQRCSPPFPLPSFSLTTVIDDSDGVPEPVPHTGNRHGTSHPNNTNNNNNNQTGSTADQQQSDEQYSCRGSRRRR